MSLIKSILTINSKKQVLLPFYHLVTSKTPNYMKHLYKPKTVRQFKTDLNVLLKYYTPISLQELISINKDKKKLTKPSFHLTFDDGLANFYEIIAPILLKNKITATVFLNTEFVDNKTLFFRYKASLLVELYINANTKLKEKFYTFTKTKKVSAYLLAINFQNKNLLDDLAKQVNYNFNDFLYREKPYLSLQQIEELQKQGFTFGTHSKNHPYYKNLPLNEQLGQTKQSIEWLTNNLDIDYTVFSFPFNDIGVSKAFFDNIDLDLSFGTSGIKKDEIPFNLHRLDMEKSNNVKWFLIKNKIKYLLKMPFGKNTVKRQ